MCGPSPLFVLMYFILHSIEIHSQRIRCPPSFTLSPLSWRHGNCLLSDRTSANTAHPARHSWRHNRAQFNWVIHRKRKVLQEFSSRRPCVVLLASRRMLLLHLLPAALLSLSVVVESFSLHSTPFPEMKTFAPVDEKTESIITSAAAGVPEDYNDASVDDDDSAAEGSAYGNEVKENKLKADMENEHRQKGTIIITCSVVASVVLLVSAILLLKHCKKTNDHGGYSLPSGTSA
ncbi:hypothetical protein NDU88_010619 [Pleurodeles waltl]|uniref:Transmembrane protein n=1 Tax=Pleurodeles waltl TaxID=8319 RepID=A0AAV7PVP1_PLEWA|nr:hypothetical protein NDU88_010619 [Pleurodeles waltl]